MQKTNVKNMLSQAVKAKRLPVILKKLRRRLKDEKGLISDADNISWLEDNCCDFKEMAVGLDATLWEEAETTTKTIEQIAEKVLNNLEYNLGGGGVYPFLYFMTRYMKPQCIVETGVAAGFSSYAFLAALKANGSGKLHSSDFPYFRLPNPERYIGIVVEESLKDNWELHVDGDEVNLPKILNNVSSVDIFHYDSDKSYAGRKIAMSMVEKALSKKAIVLMDDIQDNSFFYDYVIETKPKDWYVFEFLEKYIGMIGKPTK